MGNKIKLDTLDKYQNAPENKEWIDFLNGCLVAAENCDYISQGQINRHNNLRKKKELINTDGAIDMQADMM